MSILNVHCNLFPRLRSRLQTIGGNVSVDKHLEGLSNTSSMDIVSCLCLSEDLCDYSFAPFCEAATGNLAMCVEENEELSAGRAEEAPQRIV